MASFPEAHRRGPGKPPAAAAFDSDALATRVREIGAGAEAPVDALEPALRAILEATGTAGGALCLYDQRSELLRLAAESGLSDEGCRRLRTVRRGDTSGWDMPLHGLLNRRAYLIESAGKNRYVPPLIDSTVPVRAVACLPVYAGSIPMASLILVVLLSQQFTERHVRGLEAPLRELARIIEAMRRQASHGASPASAARPAPAPGPAGPRPEVVVAEPADRPGGADPDGARAESARVRELTAALAAAQREQARLAAELERLHSEEPRDAGRIADHVAEINRLRARLAEAEAGAAHEQRAREQLEASFGRDSSSGQSELRQVQEALRRADASRAAAVAESTRLAAEVEKLRAGGAEEQTRVADDGAEVDRLRARLAEAEAGAAHEQRAREQLEAALERGVSTGREELRHAREAARRAEAARAAAAAESTRLAAELERLRRQGPHEEGRPGEYAAEIDRLRARLAEAEAGAAHEQRAREQLEAALERGASAGQQSLRGAQEAARRAEASRAAALAESARLAAELDRLRSEGPRDDGRTAEYAAEIDRLRARLAEAEAGAAHEQRAREQLEGALERGASAGQQGLREAQEAARRAEAARATAVAENARLAAEVERLRHAESLGETLRESEAERARLAAALEAATREHATLTGAAAAERADELDHLLVRVAEAEALAGREQRAREKLDAVIEHSLVEQSEDVRQALGAARAAEEARDATAAELAQARNDLARAGAMLEALREEHAGARREIERLKVEEKPAEPLERALDEARGRERELGMRLAEREQELDTLRAETEAAGGERDRLLATAAALENERERLAADVQGGAAARAQLEETLARTLEEARGRQQEVSARLAERERELERVRAERDAEATEAAAQLEALAGECDRLRTLEAELGAERERLAADAEGAAAGRARLEEALERILEQARAREDELGKRIEEREREFGTLRAQATETAAQLDALSAEHDRLRATAGGLETERDRLAADAEGAAAARARLEETLTRTLDEARAREHELCGRVEENERIIERLRAEREAEAVEAAAHLETLGGECERLRTAAAELEAERTRLAADAEGAAAARARLEETLQRTLEEGQGREQELNTRLEGRARELETLRAEHAAEAASGATRLEDLAAECDGLRTALAGLEAERDRLAAALDEAARAEQEADAAHARLEDAFVREAAERSARGPGEAEAPAEPAKVDQPAGVKVASPPEAAKAPARAEPAPPKAAPAKAPPPKPAAPRPPVQVSEAASRQIVVLDEDAAWQRASSESSEVVVLPARDVPVERVLELAPSRLIVNLATRGALDALAKLRAAGATARFWGCIATPATDRALPLGMVEVAVRPLDPETVLAALRGHSSRGMRVLTAGADADALISLRQALARDGMSVSMAWDGKQAAELLGMIRPEVVVIELDLPPRAGHGIVAQLSGRDPLPLAVLIPGADDGGAAFVAALGNPMHTAKVVPLARIVARVLGRGDARPSS